MSFRRERGEIKLQQEERVKNDDVAAEREEKGMLQKQGKMERDQSCLEEGDRLTRVLRVSHLGQPLKII